MDGVERRAQARYRTERSGSAVPTRWYSDEAVTGGIPAMAHGRALYSIQPGPEVVVAVVNAQQAKLGLSHRVEAVEPGAERLLIRGGRMAPKASKSYQSVLLPKVKAGPKRLAIN